VRRIGLGLSGGCVRSWSRGSVYLNLTGEECARLTRGIVGPMKNPNVVRRGSLILVGLSFSTAGLLAQQPAGQAAPRATAQAPFSRIVLHPSTTQPASARGATPAPARIPKPSAAWPTPVSRAKEARFCFRGQRTQTNKGPIVK
jgi:hypothetical protein